MKSIIINEEVKITREIFYKALNIYIFNPHVINRKLNGISNVFALKYTSTNIEHIFGQLANLKTVDDIKPLLHNGLEIIEHLGDSLNYEDSGINSGYLILNKLIPRNLNLYDIIQTYTVIDLTLDKITFINTNTENVVNNIAPAFNYSIQFKKNNLSITIDRDSEPAQTESAKFIEWLKGTLFPKLLKWIDNAENHLVKDEAVKSNKLVDVEEYATLYAQLKIKYGTELVKNWKEATDPYKFVYEDIAICTYLLLIWRQERLSKMETKLQSFVDLGCGNGLLVYILSSEGHPGFGIDLRKRKIWDTFPATTILKLQSVVPSNDTVYPDIDWIIGNHSDELSPWIPVIAARSSYSTNFFLLPCCAFDFNGKKYQRVNCKLSQYMDFIDYVTKVSEDVCEFKTSTDRLKIPSTKRICIIGQERKYSEENFSEISNKIAEFVSVKDADDEQLESDNTWNTSFKPRSIVEEVRNCTQVNNDIAEGIIKLVFNQILTKRRFDPEFLKPNWNLGGIVNISDVVKLIPKEKLKYLKSECGGLKTLLKNNHQIFIVENGEIRIRLPKKFDDRIKQKHVNAKPLNYKQKSCWFHNYHPDGCPLEENDCSYKH